MTEEVRVGLAEEFRAWAGEITGEREELAREVAGALEGGADQKTRWSLINLRSEFDARRPEVREESSLVGTILTVLYLLPVFIAWWELRAAFDGYRDAVQSAPAEKSVNFLSFWTGSYDWATVGTTASAAALRVLLAVGAIVVVHAFVFARARATELRLGNERRNREADLNSLVLRASLIFAQSRAIRPEEMADVINVAAKELEQGLVNMRTALDDTKSVIDGVAGLAGSLTHSTDRLEHASHLLNDSLTPLAEFATVARTASSAVDSATAALNAASSNFQSNLVQASASIDRAVQANLQVVTESVNANMSSVQGAVAGSIRAVEEVQSGLIKTAETIKDARDGMADVVGNSTGVVNATNAMVDNLENAIQKFESTSRAMVNHSLTMKDAVSGILAASQQLNDLAKSADSPQSVSVVSVIQRVAEQMAESADQLRAAVRHVSDELARWNDGRD
jgi:hypothetical protein